MSVSFEVLIDFYDRCLGMTQTTIVTYLGIVYPHSKWKKDLLQKKRSEIIIWLTSVCIG